MILFAGRPDAHVPQFLREKSFRHLFPVGRAGKGITSVSHIALAELVVTTDTRAASPRHFRAGRRRWVTGLAGCRGVDIGRQDLARIAYVAGGLLEEVEGDGLDRRRAGLQPMWIRRPNAEEGLAQGGCALFHRIKVSV